MVPYLLRNRESVVARDDDTVIYKAMKPEPHLRVSFAECYVIPKGYFDKVATALNPCSETTALAGSTEIAQFH